MEQGICIKSAKKAYLNSRKSGARAMTYKERLLEPENTELLREAIEQLPAKLLVDVYKSYYRKTPANGVRFLGAKISKLADVKSQHILEAFERLVKHEKDYFSPLAQVWVDTYQLLLNQLEQGEEFAANTPNVVLTLALKLVKPEKTPDYFQRLVAQEKRIKQLEEQLRQQQEHSAQLQTAQSKQKLEDARLEVDKRFERQKNQLEETFRKKEQQLLEQYTQQKQKVFTKHQAEIAKLQTQIVALESTVQTAQEVQQQTQTQIQRVQEKSDREILKLSQQLKTLQATLSESDSMRQSLRTRNAELEKQLERAQKYDAFWRSENIRREREKERTIGGTELSHALVVDYAHIAAEPAKRLLVLLELYTAFLEKDSAHPALNNHSNYAEFQSPDQIHGILLLGLEQMLLDMVNLPLAAWLGAKTFHQETILRQLVTQLVSPRLSVTV
jgi:myosin heavy subunit